MIPKILYVFWLGPSHVIVEACIARMREMHPDWDVRRYSDFEEAEPVDGFDNLSVTHKTDWLRLCLIEKYGGVWLDSTIICNGTIEQCLDLSESRVVGFECPIGQGVLENWAFGAPPNHPFIAAWKREFRRAIVMGFDAYADAFPYKDHPIHSYMPYLTMHGAFIVVNARSPDAVVIRSSTHRECGPFHYTYREWKLKGIAPQWAVAKLFAWDFDYPPLLKLTGWHRSYAGRLYEFCGVRRNSFMHRTLHLPQTNRWYACVAGVFVGLMVVVVVVVLFVLYLIRRH